jgi:hypothetical protein
MAAGSDFSMFITENSDGESEILATGHNLWGEHGGGFFRQLLDLNKNRLVSN